MAKIFSVRENTGNLEILPKHRENTGNFVCSSCKFPYPKGKRYWDICHENFHFSPEDGLVCQVSYILYKLAQGKFVVGQGKHREFEKKHLSGYPGPSGRWSRCNCVRTSPNWVDCSPFAQPVNYKETLRAALLPTAITNNKACRKAHHYLPSFL